jgi:hypothetical protein
VANILRMWPAGSGLYFKRYPGAMAARITQMIKAEPGAAALCGSDRHLVCFWILIETKNNVGHVIGYRIKGIVYHGNEFQIADTLPGFKRYRIR